MCGMQYSIFIEPQLSRDKLNQMAAGIGGKYQNSDDKAIFTRPEN